MPIWQHVRSLTADMGEFRRNALVVYRCRKRGCLLGFAYPAELLPEDPIWQEWMERRGPNAIGEWCFYAFRNEISFVRVLSEDAEWEDYGEGQIYFSPDSWEKFTDGPRLPELRERAGLPLLEEIGGKIDDGDASVWKATWQRDWRSYEGMALQYGHPGWVKCNHTEAVITLEELEADRARYRHRHPIILPKR